MLNKEAIQIIKPLLAKYGHNHETYGTLVAEALKEGVLEEFLDVLYETKASYEISPRLFLNNLTSIILQRFLCPMKKVNR